MLDLGGCSTQATKAAPLPYRKPGSSKRKGQPPTRNQRQPHGSNLLKVAFRLSRSRLRTSCPRPGNGTFNSLANLDRRPRHKFYRCEKIQVVSEHRKAPAFNTQVELSVRRPYCQKVNVFPESENLDIFTCEF